MHEPCCVIVGAGPGIGLIVARRFAQGGFDIVLISSGSLHSGSPRQDLIKPAWARRTNIPRRSDWHLPNAKQREEHGIIRTAIKNGATLAGMASMIVGL